MPEVSNTYFRRTNLSPWTNSIELDARLKPPMSRSGVDERSHLDRAKWRHRMTASLIDCLFHASALDDVKSDNTLCRFGERPNVDHHLAFSNSNGHGVRKWFQRLTLQQYSTRLHVSKPRFNGARNFTWR